MSVTTAQVLEALEELARSVYIGFRMCSGGVPEKGHGAAFWETIREFYGAARYHCTVVGVDRVEIRLYAQRGSYESIVLCKQVHFVRNKGQGDVEPPPY